MFPEFLRRRAMPTTGFFLCLACLFLLSTQGQLKPEISLFSWCFWSRSQDQDGCEWVQALSLMPHWGFGQTKGSWPAFPKQTWRSSPGSGLATCGLWTEPAPISTLLPSPLFSLFLLLPSPLFSSFLLTPLSSLPRALAALWGQGLNVFPPCPACGASRHSALSSQGTMVPHMAEACGLLAGFCLPYHLRSTSYPPSVSHIHPQPQRPPNCPTSLCPLPAFTPPKSATGCGQPWTCLFFVMLILFILPNWSELSWGDSSGGL